MFPHMLLSFFSELAGKGAPASWKLQHHLITIHHYKSKFGFNFPYCFLLDPHVLQYLGLESQRRRQQKQSKCTTWAVGISLFAQTTRVGI